MGTSMILNYFYGLSIHSYYVVKVRNSNSPAYNEKMGNMQHKKDIRLLGGFEYG